MQLEIFALCHSAVIQNGSLSLLQTWERFTARSFPTKVPALAIVFRMRFSEDEAGDYDLTFRIIDPDGKIIVEAPTQIIHATPDGLKPYKATRVVTATNLKFPIEGEYWVEAFVGTLDPFRLPFSAVLKTARKSESK
jgi:hypothetical protein